MKSQTNTDERGLKRAVGKVKRGLRAVRSGVHRSLTRTGAGSLLAVIAFTVTHAGVTAAPQTAEHVTLQITHEFEYLRYLPDGYDEPGKQWPLLVFLHGAGERGHEIEAVKRHGIPKEIEAGRKLPCVVVSPQCPPGERWNVYAVEVFIERMAREYRIDPNRVYLTGLSQGAFGVWSVALRHPERYAAIIAVCGGGESRYAAALKNLPVWAFHGDQDKVVAIQRSQEMIDAIKAAGGNPRFTVYPGVGHDSWTATFANPAVYDWLLAQRRSGEVNR